MLINKKLKLLEINKFIRNNRIKIAHLSQLDIQKEIKRQIWKTLM